MAVVKLPRAPLEEIPVVNGRWTRSWVLYFHEISNLITEATEEANPLNPLFDPSSEDTASQTLSPVDLSELDELRSDISAVLKIAIDAFAQCEPVSREEFDQLKSQVAAIQEQDTPDSGESLLEFLAGSAQDEGLEDRLYGLESREKKVAIYTDTTDASGLWSVDYTAEGFASVDMVIPVLLRNAAGTIANESWATLHAFSTTTASGAGIESSSVAAGEGVEYVGAGITVYVYIIGN